jgi:hypothetical protein
MRYPGLCAAICLAVSLTATRSEALPIFYDETVDGDLSALTTITLGEGINTVLGTFGRFPTTGFESDPFDFVIPTGHQLDRLEITFSNITYLGPITAGSLVFDDFSVQPNLRVGGTGTFIGFADNCGSIGNCNLINNGSPVASSIVATFFDTMPLLAGTYSYGMGSGSANASIAATYNFHVSEVPSVPPSSVPEPGSLMLISTAIAAFGGMKLRRARR